MSKVKNRAHQTAEGRASRIAEILDGLKMEDIMALDLRPLAAFTDFFVIATARSQSHLRGAAEQAHALLKTEGLRPYVPIEDESPNWIILDYGDVVVHLFQAKARLHYRLEDLWGDALLFNWQNQATA